MNGWSWTSWAGGGDLSDGAYISSRAARTVGDAGIGDHGGVGSGGGEGAGEAVPDAGGALDVALNSEPSEGAHADPPSECPSSSEPCAPSTMSSSIPSPLSSSQRKTLQQGERKDGTGDKRGAGETACTEEMAVCWNKTARERNIRTNRQTTEKLECLSNARISE